MMVRFNDKLLRLICILNVSSWQQSRSQPQWSLGERRQYQYHIQSAPDWLSREASHPQWVPASPVLFLSADYSCSKSVFSIITTLYNIGICRFLQNGFTHSLPWQSSQARGVSHLLPPWTSRCKWFFQTDVILTVSSIPY